MSNKKRSIIILTTVILVIILLVFLLFMVNKNNASLKNDNQDITTKTNSKTNDIFENEKTNENTTEKTIITTNNITNKNSSKKTSTSKISSKKTFSKSSWITKIDDNEEEKKEVVKQLSATAKGTSTDYNIVKAEGGISNAHNAISLEDYNGELMYRFTKIVELDAYSNSAEFNFETKTNLNARIHEQAINKAKELYGDTGCVVRVEKGYAMNKSGGYVGVIGKMVIGQLNEYNWCENNVKSIYLNNRTPLSQNDEKFIFE